MHRSPAVERVQPRSGRGKAGVFRNACATCALAASSVKSRIKNSITAQARRKWTVNAAKGVRNMVAESLVERVIVAAACARVTPPAFGLATCKGRRHLHASEAERRHHLHDHEGNHPKDNEHPRDHRGIHCSCTPTSTRDTTGRAPSLCI